MRTPMGCLGDFDVLDAPQVLDRARPGVVPAVYTMAKIRAILHRRDPPVGRNAIPGLLFRQLGCSGEERSPADANEARAIRIYLVCRSNSHTHRSGLMSYGPDRTE